MRKILYLVISLALLSCNDATTTSTSNQACGYMPQGNTNSPIRIIRVLPNPHGDDTYNENFTLLNFGDAPMNLKGWKVINTDTLVWELDCVKELRFCSPLTVISVHSFGFKNEGDTIRLIDKDNLLIQTISWGYTPEGQEVIPK